MWENEPFCNYILVQVNFGAITQKNKIDGQFFSYKLWFLLKNSNRTLGCQFFVFWKKEKM